MGYKKERGVSIMDISFQEIALEWLEQRKNYIKESTYATYAEQLNTHILPALGHYSGKQITEELIQDTVCYWLNQGRADRRGGLSEKTVRDLLTTLKLCLKHGMKTGNVQEQSLHIMFPSVEKNIKENTKIKVYSVYDQRRIMKATLQQLNGKTLGILLALNCGLRIGEICALKWSDIDLCHHILYVNKTLQRVYIKNADSRGYSKIIITTPKSKASIRELPIRSKIVDVLRNEQPQDLDSYVLTGTKLPLEPRTYRRFYASFTKDNDITPLNFHCLRHTFATMCIEAGADYKTVSVLLGHSSVSITMNLYVHPSLEAKRKCVELLDNIC